MNNQDNERTMPFGRLMHNIKEELEENNPRFIKALNEELSKDGTLALKVRFGQPVYIQFIEPPQKGDIPKLQ